MLILIVATYSAQSATEREGGEKGMHGGKGKGEKRRRRGLSCCTSNSPLGRELDLTAFLTSVITSTLVQPIVNGIITYTTLHKYGSIRTFNLLI